jgi:hypothetical protein
MFTEKLVQEKEVITTSFEEALKMANSDFLVEKFGVDFKEITMTEEGRISWSGSISYPITDWTFEGLCGLLKIPVQFARRIPVDLFLENFNRLKVEHNQRVIILISRNTVINVVPHPYVFAKNKDILECLGEIRGKLNLELHEIRFSDKGMEVSFIKEGVEVEPVPRDVTRFGLNILNSETGFRGAKANFWLLRLVCTNGAILRNEWGSVKWSYDHRISYERSLKNFIAGIEKLQMDFDNFVALYKSLVNRELRAFEFVNIHRRLARIVGNDQADQIFGVPKEERNRFMRESREGDRMLLTGIILYELYNSITESARWYPFIQRRQLEALGGSLIDLADEDGEMTKKDRMG